VPRDLVFTEIVEEATGRRLTAFFSQVSHDPDIALELFLLDRVGTSADGGNPTG
jgi:hypothetical protein